MANTPAWHASECTSFQASRLWSSASEVPLADDHEVAIGLMKKQGWALTNVDEMVATDKFVRRMEGWTRQDAV